MMRQPIVAYGPVVALDISVLLGLPGLDKINPDSVPGSPSERYGADIFRAVIASNGIGLSPPPDDLVERSNDTFRWQREIDFDPEPFAVAVINDVEQPIRMSDLTLALFTGNLCRQAV